MKNALLLNTLGQSFHTSSIFVGKYLLPRKKAEAHTLLRNQSLEGPENTLLIPVKLGETGKWESIDSTSDSRLRALAMAHV